MIVNALCVMLPEPFPNEAEAPPHCNNGDRGQVRKVVGYFRCLACKEDFTVRTGTIFERSHIPLDKWLHAMHPISVARKGSTTGK